MTSAEIKARAVELGFDVCGIAPAAAFAELRFFREWLARGYAGEMQYLARSAERREDVRSILPSARSVIALGTVYNVERPYSTERDADIARLARYAWGDDYHDVIGRRMDALLEWMRGAAGEPFDARAYVDTGPVQERVYAQHAGIGWIGKNTCLINPDRGSWIFLSEILCTLPLEPDAPSLDQCGTCTLCLDACPTGALAEPYVLDSRKCLSYLTIEVKGSIPIELRPQLGAHAYGCDICQDVCPWNHRPAQSRDEAWQPRAAFDGPSLGALWRRSDEAWRRALRGSAMTRAGVRRMRRNVAVCAGSTRDADALDALTSVSEPSCADPLVAEHVAWALEQRRD
ncbi:MAG: tRNA epoxyqueuosine(34) reductase QueG [Acidobacteria bacterium]|nr:MAG: tRNA epoxyqueuosine(34) reductase QueG [Acidobacteriota bacterium]